MEQSEGICNSQSNDSILPKVRKPYTITKQREKWTDDEHQRFLEALKLYGRGWRQIEEHVGTKTAVQIRSHAQKFFSKVVRESNSGSESSVKPIEIPPPRPKRKPIHPYPRKSCVQNCHEKSSSLNSTVEEKGNKSPTSVLSAFALDNSGSTLSEQLNRCSSPNSCTNDIQSVGLISIEKENEHATSDSSLEEQKIPFSLKLESSSEGSAHSQEDAAPGSSIKLFGKTVLVTVANKLSFLDADDSEPRKSETDQENTDSVNENFIRRFESRNLDTGLSLALVTSDSSTSVPSYNQAFYPTVNLFTKTSRHERSCAGSNAIGSVCTFEKSYSPNSNEGFVPYKRCLSEREVMSPVIMSEEQERRRARVCS